MAASGRFRIGAFVLDAASGRLTRGGADVPLGGRALQLLQALCEARGQVVEKRDLIELGWPGLVVEESNLTVQIAALRKALGRSPDGGDWIVTVPRRGYRLVGAVPEGPGAVEPAAAAPASPAPSERPSIAILPFRNLSADPAQEYFADAITDDVIAALTRFRWFRVVGRSPSFAYKTSQLDLREIGRELGARYLVQGSVRRSGDKLRISAELLDAPEGQCVWADRYDFDLVDLFAVQDRIAQRVAGSIEPELLQRETRLIASSRNEGSATAWDLVAKGCWCFHQISPATHNEARALFREARRLDPRLVEAMIWLARVDAGILAFGWAEDAAAIRKEGMEAALEAVRRDEKNGYAHYALAIMGLFSDRFDEAIRAGERAVELIPSFALGHLVLGTAKLYSGDAAGAIAPLAEGLELNGHDPHNFVWNSVLALAHLFSGDGEKAAVAARTALKVRPQWRPAVEIVAAAANACGRLEEAREWKIRAAGLERPAADPIQPLWRANAAWARQMEEWLAV